MEELKDILKDAIARIDGISNSSQPNTTTEGTTAVRPQPSSSVASRPSESNTDASAAALTRAHSNFRSAFSHLYRGSRHPGPISNPRPRKKARTLAFPVRDTWTHDFLLLSSPSADKTPTMSDLSALSLAGLGRRRVVFPDKRGDFDSLKVTLEKEFPKLQSQNGAFELLRADRGGASRPLVMIPLPQVGYSVPYLKDAVTSSAVIYIRPIQSELDMNEVEVHGQNLQVLTECVNCHKSIPLQSIREHMDVCGGASSSAASANEDNGNSQTQVPSKADWAHRLREMFPHTPQERVAEAVEVSLSLEEAAEQLCSNQDQPKAKVTVGAQQYYSNVSDLVKALSAKIHSQNDYVLTVERDEVWKGALSFYKKAVNDPERLWFNLVINFKGEEGLDGGAIKAEFFQLLMQQVKLRLFEGNEFAQVPMKDRSKGFLFKLAGIMISHSIIQSGPSFSMMCPAVYYQVAGADPDKVISRLRITDLPVNAGTAVLCELIEKLNKKEGSVKEILNNDPQSEAFWATINSAHWPLTKEIKDEDVPFLLQLLLENEIILSRKYEIDQLGEGLNVLGLLNEVQNNKEVAYPLFCHNFSSLFDSKQFRNLIGCHGEPKDFAQKQSYDWFFKYVEVADENKLRSLLQFITGYRSVPPCGLPFKICLKYLADDDEKGLPTSSACLAILNIPTIHSSEAKFFHSFDVALECESQGFASA